MSRDGILLLGGSGFIGSALSRRLALMGRPVHVVSRTPPLPVPAALVLSASPAEPGSAGCAIAPCGLPDVRHHTGSLDDPALLEARRHDCATVIHLASASKPGSSARNPARELDNLGPLARLLEQLRHWPQTHLIFLSSGGTVYGNPATTPVAEDAPLAPLSFYGAGKVAMESFLQAFRSQAHPVTILRPSNCYGPGQSLRHGFGLVRTVLQQLQNGAPVEVWGDGESVRDYLYIDDLVAAILKTIALPADNGTYNIGSGQGHSINAILETVSALGVGRLQTNYRPARSVDVRAVVLDNGRAAAALDWRPRVGVSEGVRRTWDWLQQDNQRDES